MKNIMITGATGFIGSHIALACLEKKYSVKALSLPGDPLAYTLEQKGVEIIKGDIQDLSCVRQAAKGADIIFHCAAIVTDWAPKSLFEGVTVKGAENVCKAALENNVERLVDISTNDVFGLDETKILDESCPLKPWNEPYSDYKIQAEKTTWKFHKEHNLPVTMVYPCWVYGEGDRTFVPLLADAIRNKEMLFWRKDVLVWPTYIENLIDLLMLISTDDRAVGKGFLVHDGESTTLQEFSARISRVMNVKAPTFHIPYFAAYGAAVVLEAFYRLMKKTQRPLLTTYAVKNLGSRLRFSIKRAETELGWTPPFSYKQGMEKTMNWLATINLDEFIK